MAGRPRVHEDRDRCGDRSPDRTDFTTNPRREEKEKHMSKRVIGLRPNQDRYFPDGSYVEKIVERVGRPVLEYWTADTSEALTFPSG